MKKFLFFILVFVLNLAQAQDLEKLLSFYSYADIDAEVPFEKNLIDAKNSLSQTLYNSKGRIEFEMLKVNSLEHNATGKISIVPLEGGKISYKLYYTDSFLKSSSAFTQADRFLRNLGNRETALLEILANAQKDSPAALATLALQRTNMGFDDYNRLVGMSSGNISLTDKFSALNNNEFKLLQDKYIKLAKEEKKINSQALDSKAQKWDSLDVAEKQLKDMLAQGKRKEAVQILKAYLPLEMMAPVEKAQWEIWLEAMENPVPMKDRMLVVRGLEKGQFFKNAEESLYLMGPILIKNQGSYNRRLRSLKTMMEKPISVPSNSVIPNIESNSSRLSTLYTAHSNSPFGTPFISFTINPATARSFSREGIGLFAIDPRLMTLGPTTSYTGEYEILTTLFTFPDEFVAFIPHDQLKQGEDIGEQIKIVAEEKLGKTTATKMAKASGMDKLYPVLTMDERKVIAKDFHLLAGDKFDKMLLKVSPNCGQHFLP